MTQMTTDRLPDDVFFALPDTDPDSPPSFLGYTAVKREGAPIYRDAAGYGWYLARGANGSLWRAMM